MIKLTKINKYYRSSSEKFHALKDITLTLPDQGMVYIVGKSGSGKSTLLNIIGGIDSYDSGSLVLENTTINPDGSTSTYTLDTKNFKKSDYNSYRNTYIGFIFQEFNVVKGLTVYENIALSLELQKISPKDRHQDILDIIQTVGLKGKEKRRINELSGGERQRVAIARALIKDPKMIIADEPTGNLDSKNRDIVMDILKELSKKKLILIVTHDKTLASRYGDREITIKDGQIINDVAIHPECLKETLPSTYKMEPISPKSRVSLNLAWIGFKLNKFRFIFIILLFSLSLIFAGSVVNLYLADTTKEYANYQAEYGNNVVSLSTKYTYHDRTLTTGFFAHALNNAKKSFKLNEDEAMQTYTTMHVDIPIDRHIEDAQFENVNNFYKNIIQNITIYQSKADLENGFNIIAEDQIKTTTLNYYCYVTDYLVESFLVNYYYLDFVSVNNIIGKTISIPGLYSQITIAGIIDTNYEEFVKANEDGKLLKDVKLRASYEDNLTIFNSIFVSSDVYKKLYTHSNVQYYEDDILYYQANQTTRYDNIKFSSISSQTKLCVKEVNGEQMPCGSLPSKPNQGEITKVAVSKGFLEKVLGYNLNNITITKTYNEKTMITSYAMQIDNKSNYNHYLCGIRRIPSSFEFTITGIIDNDEPVIYAPSYATYPIYASWINTSFIEGGFLTAITSSNRDVNARVYRNLLNDGITINNPSFKKLQIVDNFISDNLFLFAALFFAFCLFSVLMIFNFIIINIKNSTRDIGIYMSLGMNGFKIALIYLFQVIIISSIAMVVGLVGSAIFLNSIDKSFSAQALIDFKIIKYTMLGALFVIILAYITPMIAIFQPLLSLSSKKPIDIIKVS